MSRYQARRAMYAFRRFDYDVPQESSPSITPLAKSDTTGIVQSHTGNPQARARRGNERCSWALWGVLLVAALVYIIPHINPQFNAYVVDTVTPGRAVVKADVTLAVDDHINSLIDIYAPFLNSSTPLLRLGTSEFYWAHYSRSSDDDMETLWLGGPEENLKAWNLLLTQKVCDDINIALRFRLPSLLEGDTNHDFEPLFRIIRKLKKDLERALEKQTGVAHSLASPNTTDLWVHRVRVEFLQLFSDLHEISAESKLELGSALAASEENRRTAEALYRYVDEGGPWQSINKEIRSNLSMLRQECVRFPQDLEHLHWRYNMKVFDLHRDSMRRPRVGQPKLIPVAHAESLVSAIDESIVALDAVDNGLLRLRTQLNEQREAGWEPVEEIKYGVRVRARVRLPPPGAIQKSVSARLERLVAEASGMQETLSHISAAEKALIRCMKGKGGRRIPQLGRMHSCLQMGAFPPYTYTEQIAYTVTHVMVRIFYAVKKVTGLLKL